LRACKLNIRGGLGNQLFQFFAGAYVAQLYSCPLLIDDRHVRSSKDLERRNQLTKFPNEALEELGVDIATPRLSNLFSLAMGCIPTTFCFDIDDEIIDNLSEVSKPFGVLEGWFQKPKYVNSFSHVLFFERLIERIKFNSKDSLLLHGDDLRNAAIHFRLGDYVQHGWQIPFEWYFQRIDEMYNHGITRIFVFSDEISVVKKVLAKRYKTLHHFTFPEDVEKLNSLQLMLSMSFFKNYVSSNSTLSWWSSFVDYKNKNVVFTPWDEVLAMPNWKSRKP
jgi:hypothetical protein